MKYPVLIPYRATPDDGAELKYALRSLKNLKNWNGEVIIAGDKPRWMVNVTHIQVERSNHNPYHDSENRAFAALIDDRLPEDFIFSNDDIFITEPIEVTYLHQGTISTEGRGYHISQKKKTREWLAERGFSTFDYDLHTPMLMNKTKRLKVHKVVQESINKISLKPRSIYGNMFAVAGEVYEDRKARGQELPQAPIISTSTFVKELEQMFPEPSKFESTELKPRLLISSHFSYLNMRTGMTLMVRDIARALSSDFEVDIYTNRGNNHRKVEVDGIVHYDRVRPAGKYDLTLAHSPYNPGRDVQLFDTVKDVGKYCDPNRTKPRLAVFTTESIRKAYGYTGPSIILHPPVFPEEHNTQRGDKITCIGMSEPKGGHILIELAKNNPDKQFLGVVSGWGKDMQERVDLPNLEIMDEVSDPRDIWEKTRILVSPSYEQYGKANLEAMASGIPVIAFDCSGTREALGDAAMFVPNRELTDVPDWQNALTYVENNYDEYSDRSFAQSQRVDSRKELEELVKCVKDLL